MRLAQVANYVGPQSGGLRVVVDTLGAAHVRSGGERLIILPDARPGVNQQGRHRRVAVTSPALPGSRGRYRVLVRRRAVIAALEAFGPELVEVHDQTTLRWVADWAAKAGVPCVLFAHERLDQVAREILGLPPQSCGRIGRRLAERLAADVDAVVCASAFAAEPFRNVANVHRIPFGVDLDTFSPSAATPATPWQRDVFRLVFSGRMQPEKAPDVAVEVLAGLHRAGLPVELIMLGSGPLETSLRRRVRRQRLPVRFLGHVPDRARLAGILAAADLALAPGPRETFGLSVLEAMACGTPVVVSSRGASRELLAPGVGAVGDDPTELTGVIRELLSDPAARARAATLARHRAEQFPWPTTLDALARLRSHLTGRQNLATTPAPVTGTAEPREQNPCYGTDPGPLAIAHRGGAGLGPENTLATFDQAYALGFRYLETDVRVTADGVCALFHDATTRRLTGMPGRFDALTWAQAERLRILGREPVARLDDLLATFPDARIAVDLKDPQALGRLAAVVRRFGAHDRVCLAGTADHWLGHGRALLGHGLITAMGWQSTVRLITAARLGVRPRDVRPAPFVHVPLRLHGVPVFFDRVVPMAAELGSRVVVWTVDDPCTMGRLLDAGVHGLISDRPDLLREVLVARGTWHPPETRAARPADADPVPPA